MGFFLIQWTALKKSFNIRNVFKVYLAELFKIVIILALIISAVALILFFFLKLSPLTNALSNFYNASSEAEKVVATDYVVSLKYILDWFIVEVIFIMIVAAALISFIMGLFDAYMMSLLSPDYSWKDSYIYLWLSYCIIIMLWLLSLVLSFMFVDDIIILSIIIAAATLILLFIVNSLAPSLRGKDFKSALYFIIRLWNFVFVIIISIIMLAVLVLLSSLIAGSNPIIFLILLIIILPLYNSWLRNYIYMLFNASCKQHMPENIKHSHSHKSLHKKSQVTLFVILGIVIIIIVGLAIYLTTKEHKISDIPQRTDVSDELKPLQQYVEQCMFQIGEEAIIMLGSHGGYIDPSNIQLSGKVFDFDPATMKESDMFSFSDKSSGIAYWLYSKSNTGCDDCRMGSQMPVPEEMSYQISRYVEQNLYLCINDFSEFTDKGYIITLEGNSSNITASTILADDDVSIRLSYPVTVAYQGAESHIDSFYTTIDLPLMKYYYMSMAIAASEYDSGFLEKLNSYLVNTYSGMDPSKLAPIYGYEEDTEAVFWMQSVVKTRFEQLLTSYIPLMQVPNTRYYTNISFPGISLYDRNFYNIFLNLDFFNGTKFPTTDISFVYPGKGLNLRVNPYTGEMIRPIEHKSSASSISLLPPSKSYSYNFFYDISYPVIVEIRDEYKPGKYYTFMFALESNTKQNSPLSRWLEGDRPLYWDEDFMQITVNDPKVGSQVQSTDPNSNTTYNYVQRPSKNLFCEQSQRISGDIRLSIYNAATEAPISGADIIYGCGDFASCSLSYTDVTAHANSISFKLPICYNGYLSIIKEGYQTKILPLTTSPNAQRNLGAVYLEPLITKDVRIIKYTLGRKTDLMRQLSAQQGRPAFMNFPENISLGKYYIVNITSLSTNDTLILTLNKKPSAVIDQPLMPFLSIIGDSNMTINTIDLIPGKYTMNAQLLDNEGFIVPAKCKKICHDDEPLNPFNSDTCEKIPDDPIPMKPAPWGGINFDANNSIIITREDLLANNTLTIYVLRIPNPPCLDEMAEVSDIAALSKSYRTLLLPKFT